MNKKFLLIVIFCMGLAALPIAAWSMSDSGENETATELSTLTSDEIKQAALKSLIDLADAYSKKMRSAFMRLVSENFKGDLFAFEDAILKDFRNYRDVNLDFIPDTITVNGSEAEVGFRYNLSVVDNQGTQTLYNGNSAYSFDLEDGKMKLFRMALPILFGNSLPTSENPIAIPQAPATGDEGSAPGEFGGAIITGSESMTTGQSFRFSSEAVLGDTSGDLIIRGTGTGVEINPGGGLESLGTGSLGSVTSVPSNPSTQFIDPVQVSDLIAVKTLDGKYAVIRITGVGATINFEYKYQPNGSTSF